jgi:ribonuclease P/MRP protein subunit POP5
MKPVLPSLREKKRYVVFEIISKNNINNFPEKEIKNAFLQLFGEVNLGKSGLIFLKNKWKDNKGVIRVNNKHVDELKASLCMVKKINNKQATVKSVGVSGTLKKAELKFCIEKQNKSSGNGNT